MPGGEGAGLKFGKVGAVKFEERIGELTEGMPDLAEIVEPLLDARRKLRQNYAALHRKILAIVRDDEVCRRLMSIPGVAPSCRRWPTPRRSIIPARFRNSKAVGPILGLTPALHESGESRRVGGI
ncbi:transposase [Mesorhizobium sp. M0136]|uniref:transposase n=1 Tax=Mesorhizobium sp. M0136 TaxID=2956890 RepID=UPI0033383E5F